MNKQQQKWFLIVINDPSFLASSFLVTVINEISGILSLKYVIMDYIDGSGDNYIIPELQEKTKKIFELNEILPLLIQVKQFEWGDFFLFKNYPLLWMENENWHGSNEGNTFDWLYCFATKPIKSVTFI